MTPSHKNIHPDRSSHLSSRHSLIASIESKAVILSQQYERMGWPEGHEELAVVPPLTFTPRWLGYLLSLLLGEGKMRDTYLAARISVSPDVWILSSGDLATLHRGKYVILDLHRTSLTKEQLLGLDDQLTWYLS